MRTDGTSCDPCIGRPAMVSLTSCYWIWSSNVAVGAGGRMEAAWDGNTGLNTGVGVLLLLL